MKISNILWFTLALILCFSCGKDDETPSLPEWNKEHTATVQFYSRFNQTSLFGDDNYTQVISGIQSATQQIVVLDRADVVYSETGIVNPTVSIASSAGRVPLFVAGSLTGERVEGTGVLIKHTITESGSVNVAPGAAMFTVLTKVNNSIPITFSTLSLNNENQISTGLDAITSNIVNNGAVLVGSIDKALKDKLASKFPSKTFRLATVESNQPGASRIIFVLSSLKWVLRESAEVHVNDNGLSRIDLKIEAL
jgi:hypothetical protein